MPVNNADEINLLEYFYVLVKNKWLILVITIVGYILGHGVAKWKGPEYIAEAVIEPREAESTKSPNLSSFGMLGGMVASQLNIGGSASLDKIEIILDSRKFNAELVEKKNLLPLIYAEFWDTTAKEWKGDFVPPELPKVGGYIRNAFFEKEKNKNNTMVIKVTSKDSLLSYTLLSDCLEYLDRYLKAIVQTDAKENRDYLEHQLINVTDPLLRAKIQELIAAELEKMMVVSKEAFRYIDPVFTIKSNKMQKLLPIVGCATFMLFCVMLLLFVYAFNSSKKTEEDDLVMHKVYLELFRLPFKKII